MPLCPVVAAGTFYPSRQSAAAHEGQGVLNATHGGVTGQNEISGGGILRHHGASTALGSDYKQLPIGAAIDCVEVIRRGVGLGVDGVEAARRGYRTCGDSEFFSALGVDGTGKINVARSGRSVSTDITSIIPRKLVLPERFELSTSPLPRAGFPSYFAFLFRGLVGERASSCTRFVRKTACTRAVESSACA